MSKKKPGQKGSEEGKAGKVIGNGLQLLDLLPGVTFNSVWETPEAFVRHVEGLNRDKAWHDSAWTHDDGFYGTEDMAEALKLAKEGWKEGAEIIERVRARVQAEFAKGLKLIRYDIAGSTPNVARAVAGNILNMKATDLSRARRKKVVTLLCDMSSHCGIKAETITNRAAAIAAIVDEIESKGYSCEVISTATTKGYGGYSAATSVIAKQSHQPVDITRLAFCLGHSSMFRRLIFADWGSEDSAKDGLGWGLGRTLNYEIDAELKERHIYFLPPAQRQPKLFKDEETTAKEGLEYLIDYLKDQGCPAFEGDLKSEAYKKEKETGRGNDFDY